MHTINHSVNSVLHHVAILAFTVMFEQSTYNVNENAGPARPVLVLSGQSSMAFNVTVFTTDGSATGGSTISEYCSISFD